MYNELLSRYRVFRQGAIRGASHGTCHPHPRMCYPCSSTWEPGPGPCARPGPPSYRKVDRLLHSGDLHMCTRSTLPITREFILIQILSYNVLVFLVYIPSPHSALLTRPLFPAATGLC